MVDVPAPASNPSRRLWLVIATALIIGGLAFVWALLDMQSVRPYVAPDFTLTTFNGETYRLSDLRGKVVVLNFWASWCAPCRAEAPTLQILSSRFAPEDVAVLGIAYEDNDEQSQAYLKALNITYPNGEGNDITAAYRVQGLPTTIVINREGIVTDTILAEVQFDDLIARIDRARQPQ